jgi:hypothetical protein
MKKQIKRKANETAESYMVRLKKAGLTVGSK